MQTLRATLIRKKRLFDGSCLTAAAASDAIERWQAGFVKLPVYADNLSALAFYDRLGFAASKLSEHYLVLKGNARGTLLNNTQTSGKHQSKGELKTCSELVSSFEILQT